MSKRHCIVGWIAVVACVSAAGQTLDQVIARNVLARGGSEKLKAVETLRESGTVIMPWGIEAPFVVHLKRPNRVRFDFVAHGITFSRASNGTFAWDVNPSDGNNTSERMDASDQEELQEMADFDGPWVDYKQKGNRITLMGKEIVDGVPCYKLKVVYKNGDTKYFYIDSNSYLVVRQDAMRDILGTKREVITALRNYRRVDGVMFAMEAESSFAGAPRPQKMVIDKIEVNTPIQNSDFGMTGVQATDPPPKSNKP